MLDALQLFNGNRSARKASDAVQQGNNQAIGTINGFYDKSAANYQPYLNYGQGMGGLGGLDKLNSGDNSGWMNSPDFKAAQDAGMYSMDHSAAARGRLYSGGYGMDAAKGLGDIASGYLGNYRNSLQWGANLGQQSAQGLGQLGAYAGKGIADMQHDSGLARAGKQSAYGNNGNTFLNSFADHAGQLMGGRG